MQLNVSVIIPILRNYNNFLEEALNTIQFQSYQPKEIIVIGNIYNNRKIKEMEFLVTAVPNQEAEYPGGNKKITEYFTKNVINKISENGIIDSSNPATVTYTINEDGKAADAKLSKTSSNTLLNKLLLEAVTKMPNWKPAKNNKGTKVKEEFKISIPFYFNNGC
jgi:TonB family protein